MNCHECGYEIESGFAFCPKCGAKQQILCSGCGYSCPPHFAFCPQCGTQVSASAPSGARSVPLPRPQVSGTASPVVSPARSSVDSGADRRTVTIVFADLCSFTALGEQVDPETLQALQNELFEELTEAVEAFGGFVDKFIGDALLALFGAPVAHEDDPERALRAAQEMVRRAAQVGERWRKRIGLPLNLHIGVNTGPVVAGAFGAGDSKSYSVTGDTVNTAQRLQSMAGPDEILVGPVTHRLTRHAFAYETLGAVALRGKAGSVHVHRLTGALEVPRAARGLDALGLSAPLIGRDKEIGRLRDCLALACSGTAQLVRLTGEAGIGKSRLVNDFLAGLAGDALFAHVVVRRAGCSPLGEPSYGTLAKVLRSAYGISSTDTPEQTQEALSLGLAEIGFPPAEIEQLMPLFFHILGIGDRDGMLQHIAPEQVRRQLFSAIRTILERRLDQAPLLLVIEDLHWADSASLEALRFALDRLDRRPLMLLTTQRPNAGADRLAPGRTSLTALRLGPLSAPDGQRLLSALFGEGGLPKELCERILRRAGGNPLFVEEIVRSLIDLDMLRRDGSRWHVAASEATVDIPIGIEAMLLARIDRLPQEVRRLVHCAAVIGPSFEAHLLKSIAVAPANVDQGLELLCDTEIIEESGSERSSQTYRFMQSLLHEVVYNNLLVKRRAEIHAAIAEALERRYGEDPQRFEELALLGHHFSQSKDRSKSARYLMAAGDRARQLCANEDAIRYYRQAMAALAALGEERPEWFVARERVADLLGPAGERGAAEEHYRALLACERVSADPVASARILRKLGHLLWEAGNREQAQANFTEAAALLARVDAPVESASLLQERGHLAFRMGDYLAASEWADEALSRVKDLGLDAGDEMWREAALVTAEALNTKGVALARRGRRREAIAAVEESVAVAEAATLMQAACRGYTNLGVLYTIVDPKLAIDVCRRGLNMARRAGDLGFEARLLANLAVAYCTFTDRCAADGVPAAEKAIEIDRALDQRDHLPVSLLVLGQIYQCHDQPHDARRLYGEALDLAAETGEAQLLFPCYDGLGALCLDAGDLDEAERYFTLARDICVRHDLDPEALVILPFLD
ncbi:adenylate/guanylate cyclase domain-containing protein [Sinorhizobium sp. 7-81]|uniref:adenylate/guanylate cyclase domain-containing protein n=1 Tax=Sinorhizobium sp. 8-89 TaxID=3049089 RepID=UPI0024C3A160|nr:adenylate/guanylate cyclase domain-containing protein [Sinorhizobium sp. 8-89]MDK1490625.1 adenylate/guanylate cyclase domain-containing protein [Sinorhizobium sp. 8-89]